MWIHTVDKHLQVFCFCGCQVKDDGLVDDEKREEEEAPQQSENKESIIGAVETIESYWWSTFNCH